MNFNKAVYSELEVNNWIAVIPHPMWKERGIILNNYKTDSLALMENRTTENKDKEETAQYIVGCNLHEILVVADWFV